MPNRVAVEETDGPQLYFKVILIFMVFTLPLLSGSSVKWTPVGSFMVLALLLWPWKMRQFQVPDRNHEPHSSM
jgi:hypothetical protein